MSFAFVTAGWPLAKTVISVAIAWAVIQIVMTTVIRKKLTREGFTQFLIEGILMLIMTIAIIIYMQ
jgi:predicted membrane channel-forming protein YqfA (hemolysin III family)